MDSLIGYPLEEALNKLEKSRLIVKIVKVKGFNKRFGELEKPYVIRENYNKDTVTLYITYF
ncbi:MAG TPA: hypothetical protein PLV23_10310 [Sedimentibacter sp.]|jgi:hypothetical protein|nr:hypothetical protein [Sedimentibacter sp.]HHZ01022.1 hypothetical protein [Tissierellia bacterium]HOK48579.1 hypothetical protein [Sedimentibacter sp.]HOW24003.1 hypothetical protein [Sedimentibacter sp.]HRC80176.1 hypothetical protein [Sedimentibacter sp.]